MQTEFDGNVKEKHELDWPFIFALMPFIIIAAVAIFLILWGMTWLYWEFGPAGIAWPIGIMLFCGVVVGAFVGGFYISDFSFREREEKNWHKHGKKIFYKTEQ